MRSPRLADFQYINPPGVFDPSAIYTHIVVPPHGRPVFLSGQWGGNENGELVEGGFPAQVEQAFRNVETQLAAVGLTLRHVTKLVHYVVELEQVKRTALHAIAKTLWPVNKPASTLLGVSRLAREGMVYEVDAHAVIPD